MSDLNSKRVAKNTGILFIRMFVLMGIGLFTSREILRILGVDDFGIYNLVGTIVVMFTFLQTALNNATSRFITFDLGKGNENSLQRTFSMSINVELLLVVIIFLLSEIVGPWFIEHKLHIPIGRGTAAHIVFQLSLVNFLIGLIRTPFNSLIIAHEKMDFFAYTSIIEAVFKLLIVYMLTIIEYDKLIVFGALQIGVVILIFLWLYVYCKRHFKECNYIRYWDSLFFKKLTNYSGLSLLVNLSDIAVIQSITIFFNIFSGVVANAALAIANQVNTHLNQFVYNFSQSYSPQIIKSYAAGEYDYFMKLIFSSSKISFFLFFAVSFPVLLNISFLLDIWLVTPPPLSDIFLMLICSFSLLDSFSQPLWTAVHATGNLKVHQLLMGSIKILNIPISYILLKLEYHIVSVLIVYVLLNIVCTVVRIWWMKHLIKMDISSYVQNVMWPMVKIVIISIPAPIVIYNCFSGVSALISSTVLFWIIYFFSVYYIALNTIEKKIVDGFISKVRASVY